MKNQAIEDLKTVVRQNIETVTNQPKDKSLKGFQIGKAEAKKEGYLQALKEVLTYTNKVSN